MPASRIEIDLNAIEHNAHLIKRVVAQDARTVDLCAVLKQDAYGAGAARIASRLVDHAGLLGVYTPDEARELVEGAIVAPVLLLMPIRSIERFDPLYRHASIGRLHLTLHDRSQLADLEKLARTLGIELPVHLFVDTGMARGGALPKDAQHLFDLVQRSKRIRLAGIMTHFASAVSDGEYTKEQAATFRVFLAPLLERLTEPERGRIMIHAADSAATFRSRRYHGTMVRVGQALHGYVGDAPADRFDFADELLELKHSLRWVSQVVHEVEVPEGQHVGYGATWRTLRASRIALIPVGYAHGYRRSLGNTGVVGFSGRAWDGPAAGSETPMVAPVVGRVSMDQITVDVTDLPRTATRVGMEVELISVDRAAPNSLPNVASASGTVVHDILCGLSPRLSRVYRFDAKPVVAGNAARMAG